MKGRDIMNLTKANLNDVIEGISFSEFRSISLDEDAKKAGDKKTIMLVVKYDGLTLGDIIAKAYKSDCVSFQNGGSGRKNYDKIVDKSTITIEAKSPGKGPQVDPVEAIIASAAAAGMTIEAYLRAEVDKRKVKA